MSFSIILIIGLKLRGIRILYNVINTLKTGEITNQNTVFTINAASLYFTLSFSGDIPFTASITISSIVKTLASYDVWTVVRNNAYRLVNKYINK